MAKRKKNSETPGATAANVGYEAQLWQMADALRGSMDAAEYKHVCLGLLFLKYISDAFEERHEYLTRAVNDPKDEYYLPPSTPNRSDTVTRLFEDPDEYRTQSIFWVPPEARWSHLKAQARQPTVGQLVDDAEDELAFYDALETNDSAVKVLGDETLRTIAQELVKTVRANATIDWTLRENVRAQLRVLVKRILRRYGYPPDKQEKATETVLEQAALLSAEWAVA
ncbi:MAG TPA: type I restriction enzyme endonuclease domain-containing protein [Candidatus Baltobacteraceae bacterium]|nr:type I restriction enzyme endonuclease domain-containing protein [Candidatus Baltobacteraceae bacterium]